MSDEQDNKVLEQRVCLPKPDVDNITVLTKNLPNGPVLPWHHFDSPWLKQDEEEAEADTTPESEESMSKDISEDDEDAQQLSLELRDLVEPSAESSHSPQDETEMAREGELTKGQAGPPEDHTFVPDQPD